jgi:hypothetical protein
VIEEGGKESEKEIDRERGGIEKDPLTNRNLCRKAGNDRKTEGKLIQNNEMKGERETR